MEWSDLLAGLALYFVLEGVMPFLNPQWVKRMMTALAASPDGYLRAWGLVSMSAGLALLYFVRS
jgi:hypothetical protein